MKGQDEYDLIVERLKEAMRLMRTSNNRPTSITISFELARALGDHPKWKHLIEELNSLNLSKPSGIVEVGTMHHFPLFVDFDKDDAYIKVD